MGGTMLTDFVRHHAFTIAWFGLMTFVWFGWSQEDPTPRWRWVLGVGSLLGAAIAGVFVPAVVTGWDGPSALEGHYVLFGVIVLLEVLLAGLGALVLWRRGRARWTAWWIALVVALHFIPLAVLLGDWSLVVLSAAQTLGLILLVPRLQVTERATSHLAGPLMGSTLLAFACASILVFLVRHGTPW